MGIHHHHHPRFDVTVGALHDQPSLVEIISKKPRTQLAIMPSKYTDEIENASDTWRVFLYGKKIKIFTPAKVNYYQ